MMKRLFRLVYLFFLLVTLGPNGAGKTTTMRIIIAEESPSQGKVKIGPYDIVSNDSPGFEQLGYCPQVSKNSALQSINNILPNVVVQLLLRNKVVLHLKL